MNEHTAAPLGVRNIRLWAAFLIGAVIIMLLWHQVFVMTGVLWWDAPLQQQVVAVPESLPTVVPEIGWVDLDSYLRTHPTWDPPQM